jgi:iron complex transport system ATP-binding protein
MVNSRPAGHGPLISVEHVDLRREGRLLLDDVSLVVAPGEHWALIGPNGAGKTTLLNLMGAVIHPTAGRVHVLGRRMGAVDVRELRTYIGHVNPRHPLESPLTVEQVVLTGATGTNDLRPRWRPSAEQRARAEELVKALGLAHRQEARWPILSQGERGRTLIARALMARPRLLLLDEPATGLDLAAREQLITALDVLGADEPELASVLVTHHLEDMPGSTTHAVLLQGGRRVAAGPVDEVVTTENISACFDHPVRIARADGRWTARAAR